MIRLACAIVLATTSAAYAQAPPGVLSAPVEVEAPETAEVQPAARPGGGGSHQSDERMSSADNNLVSSIAPVPHGRIHWDPSWPRYRLDELVLTIGMGLVIGLAELLPTRSEPNWSGTTDFDIAASDALGANSPDAREGFRIASDVAVGALIAWPLLIDSLVYAGLGEGSWDVAWQLSLITLEVMAINHALNIGIKLLSRRERPVNTYCRERPGYADDDPNCEPGNLPAAESFWSAHASNAFAAAAVVCMGHEFLNLFGDEVTDGLACGSALALAAATGLFRVASDRHWLSDVLTGAVIGTLTGTLIPYLLHFQGGARPPLPGTEAPVIAVLPMFDEETIGLSAVGLW